MFTGVVRLQAFNKYMGTKGKTKKKAQGAIDKKQKKHKIKLDARRIVMIACALVAVGSLGYYAFYAHQSSHSSKQASNLKNVKNNNDFVFYKEARVWLDDVETPPILDEYAGLYELNKSVVGWIKIDGTQVDYPVMQTKNDEYYLDHNFDQEEDKNGSIFVGKDCSIFPRSQNLLIFGHNMRSGKMFGSLKSYKDINFFNKHPQIQFDTIYEKGIYDIMYVFPEVIHDEDEVTFKYYQFVNANSEEEYNSYMNDMAAMSLYDTGVTSYYGDALITLSTCDYEKNAERFVIVAKKVD